MALRVSEWRKLPVSLTELCINTTLRCGQSFRHDFPASRRLSFANTSQGGASLQTMNGQWPSTAAYSSFVKTRATCTTKPYFPLPQLLNQMTRRTSSSTTSISGPISQSCMPNGLQQMPTSRKEPPNSQAYAY